jgi:hypothetical protein
VELVQLSSNGQLIGANESSHYVHLDQPMLVINAIRSVVHELLSSSHEQ